MNRINGGHGRRPCTAEFLESRRLLAGSVLQPDGTLLITGTSGADDIVFRYIETNDDERDVEVEVNGTKSVYTIPHDTIRAVRISAGAGHDTIEVDEQTFGWVITADGGDGNDTFVHAPTQGAEIYRVYIGGTGDDTVLATDLDPFTMTFDGGPGIDLIDAHGQVTFVDLERFPTVENVTALDGAISINGNDLNNRIEIGGDQISYSSGRAGDDLMIAHDQYVVFDGEEGNDTLIGGSASEDVDGASPLGDFLFGGPGHDSLVGGDGYDWFEGGSGTDTISGGALNDSVLASDGGDLVTGIETTSHSNVNIVHGVLRISGTDGDDSVTLQGSATGQAAPISVTYGQVSYSFDREEDRIGLVSLSCGLGNDSVTMIGWAFDTFILMDGQAGDDTYTLSGAVMWYVGFAGGKGNDTFANQGFGHGPEFSGGPGIDLHLATVPIESVQLNAGVENARGPFRHVMGNELDNHIEITGNVGANVSGYAGDDTIIGGSGHDTFFGGDGNDILIGNDGNDLLSGNGGKDRLFGGLGRDRLNGHGGHDRLYGEAGADRLFGYAGNDWIDGGSSIDRLYAGSGTDTLLGQAGNDLLYARNSTLTYVYGGGGTDRAQVDDEDELGSIEALLA